MNVEEIREIEGVAARAWPATERQGLHGWILRAGGASSRRLNSALTLGFSPGQPLDSAIAAVDAWYAARGLPACFSLTEASLPTGLDAALAERGYALVTPTWVMTRPLAETATPVVHEIRIDLDTYPSPAAMTALHEDFADPSVRRERAALYARLKHTHAFVVVFMDGEPVGAALGVVIDQWLGLFALRVAPTWRGQGLAGALIARLFTWGGGFGTTRAFLQVIEANGSARACFKKAGFNDAYRYWYRERGALPPT